MAKGLYTVLLSIRQKQEQNTFLEEVIREDYGDLLEGDQIETLPLIKWASRKHFYQQVMTIIESRIPTDLVREGILYYAVDEDSLVAILEEFAREYDNPQQNSRWFFDDLDHFFIKYYGRSLVSARQSREKRADDYAKLRVESVSHGREGMIKAWSRLRNHPDVLEEVLCAYYRIAPIRNEINHAESRAPERSLENIDINQKNERLTMLTEAISRFISAYENALEAREPGETPARLDVQEFRDYLNAGRR